MKEIIQPGTDIGRPIRVGVINNPLSGHNRRGGTMRKLRDELRAHPDVIHHEVSALDDMTAAAIDLLHRDVELLVVNGGDGTAHAVLTALFREAPPEHQPLLAVLPGGTTNTTSGDVGTREHPVKSLPKLLAQARAGRLEGIVERRAVMRIDGAQGKQSIYGMVFGAGAVYHGVKYYHENIEVKGIRGELGSGLTVAVFAWKVIRGQTGQIFPPLEISGTVDGKELPRQLTYGAVISTLRRIFLGLRPFWATNPGAMQCSILSHQPQHLLRAIWEMVREKPGEYLLNERCFTSRNADDIELHFEGGFMVDGEIYPIEPGKPVVLHSGATAPFWRPLA